MGFLALTTSSLLRTILLLSLVCASKIPHVERRQSTLAHI
jgi:hypothetical protein